MEGKLYRSPLQLYGIHLYMFQKPPFYEQLPGVDLGMKDPRSSHSRR